MKKLYTHCLSWKSGDYFHFEENETEGRENKFMLRKNWKCSHCLLNILLSCVTQLPDFGEDWIQLTEADSSILIVGLTTNRSAQSKMQLVYMFTVLTMQNSIFSDSYDLFSDLHHSRIFQCILWRWLQNWSFWFNNNVSWPRVKL